LKSVNVVTTYVLIVYPTLTINAPLIGKLKRNYR